MIRSHPHIACQKRKSIAAEILATPDCELEITTRKLKHLCAADLEQASHDGTTGWTLFSILDLVALMLMGDIQNLEGTNSVIKAITKKAPAIGLPLASARVGLKYKLGAELDFKKAKAKSYSQSSPALKALHTKLSECGDDAANDILQEEGRWQAPPPAIHLPDSKTLNQVWTALFPHYKKSFRYLWGHKYELQYYRFINCKPSVSSCICIDAPRSGDPAYLCVDTSYGTCFVVEARIHLDVEVSGTARRRKYKVSVTKPFEICTLADVIMLKYDIVNGGTDLKVRSYKLDWGTWYATGFAKMKSFAYVTTLQRRKRAKATVGGASSSSSSSTTIATALVASTGAASSSASGASSSGIPGGVSGGGVPLDHFDPCLVYPDSDEEEDAVEVAAPDTGTVEPWQKSLEEDLENLLDEAGVSDAVSDDLAAGVFMRIAAAEFDQDHQDGHSGDKTNDMGYEDAVEVEKHEAYVVDNHAPSDASKHISEEEIARMAELPQYHGWSYEELEREVWVVSSK